MQMDEHNRYGGGSEVSPTGSMAEFDEARYLPYLAEFDMTEAQKREFVLIVWNIMRMWIELDLPLDSCGQIIEALIDPSKADSVDVQ